MKNLSKLTSEKLPHWILSCDQATYTTMPRVPILLSNSHKNIFFFYLEGFFIREDSKKAQRSPSCARLSLHHCQHHHDHFHLYSHKSSSFGSSLGVIQTCIYVSHCYASQWPTSESFYSSPVYYIIRSSSQVLYKVWTFSLSFSRLYVLVFNNNILINIMNIWSLLRIRVPSYIFRWLFIRLPLF